jgi:hypothetical protein
VASLFFPPQHDLTFVSWHAVVGDRVRFDIRTELEDDDTPSEYVVIKLSNAREGYQGGSVSSAGFGPKRRYEGNVLMLDQDAGGDMNTVLHELGTSSLY